MNPDRSRDRQVFYKWATVHYVSNGTPIENINALMEADKIIVCPKEFLIVLLNTSVVAIYLKWLLFKAY